MRLPVRSTLVTVADGTMAARTSVRNTTHVTPNTQVFGNATPMWLKR